MTSILAAVDELFAARFEEGFAPGLVYGVVRHGELVHARGLGTVSPATPSAVPDEHTVMRIASMTKSFTAAALLLLRDRGLVDLDEAVAQYVPELVDQAPYSASSPAVTLRHLLTMAAGLPSDNPWGDRQESLTYEEFGTFLDGGFTPVGEVGVRFEYANLGYALLGRVIDNVVGQGSSGVPEGAGRDFVEHELLAPLGLVSTRYDVTLCGPRLAPGHHRRGGDWVEAAPMSPGAFSPMGGLHSTITDLAGWVAGLAVAYDERPDGHPLSKATRRELQQMHRFERVSATLSTDGPGAVASGYGYGLMIDHDDRLGQIVHHSGGYPGYGSRMLWHPETGLGVVTMSNGTYGGAYPTSMEALKRLVRAEARRPSAPAIVMPEVGRVTDHVRGFDPAGQRTFADPGLFADNVELDVPDAERRRELAQARERVGAPTGAPGVPRSETLAHAAWMVPAERGRYELAVLLSPEATPRWQYVGVTAVPAAAPGVLERARAALAAPTAETRLMRAFGEPVLLEAPVSAGERSVELLAGAGGTWWKVTVPLPDGEVALVPHETASYPRLAWFAEQGVTSS